ncbi:MAG: thiamine biosynthesis lipoprotein ApbE [Rhodobacteraceae bacterium HLUCCA12]|nr:MAG: thiamine biosynthesis lipoprotein ApbE [Rhodobacteraceae bacterium HLUCCA12]
MTAFSRRRFLAIAAAAAAATPAGAADPAPLYQWRGVALGADAAITLAHPQAESIVARARDEIARLERIFSLHHPESALVRLNRAGALDNPPFELLECLGLCGAVHAATGGRFDPTIQPLWALYAEHYAKGGGPSGPNRDALSEARARTGWNGVRMDAASIRLRTGMALSLNGVAQGYIADRVAALLRADGLENVLVNTGEHHALGGQPQGGAWPITLDDGRALHRDAVMLENAALASSAPHGITFDQDQRASHILDPRTGRPAPAGWRLISVVAPRAGLADALSTAFCLMDRPAIDAALAEFPRARLAHLG